MALLSRDAIPQALQHALHQHRNGQPQLALERYQEILSAAPERADVWNLAAEANRRLGRLDDALRCADRALALDRTQASFRLLRGQILQALRRPADAASEYREALRLSPALSEAHNSMGIALRDLGRTQEAMQSFQAALAADQRHARASFNLATLEQQTGLEEEALAHYRHATAIDPNYAEAWCRTGILLRRQQRYADAVQCLEQALRLRARYFDAHFNLGLSYERLCRLPEAIEAYRAAIEIRPESADAYNSLANALANHCRHDEALTALRKAVELAPSDARIHSNLLVCMHYSHACDNAQIFEEHREWARRHAAPLAHGIREFTNSRDPAKRLRIGYVAADFNAGPMHYFLDPLLANHDRSGYEIYAYSSFAEQRIASETKSGRSVKWRTAAELDSAGLAEMVRRDEIDILVDLSGHTPGNRLLTFAHKPAPVQVSWLDYFDTTGLDTIDYLISDAVHTPPEGSQQFTETIARLPVCRLCYAPPPNAPEVADSPHKRNGYITLGCFNRLSKLTPECIDLWCSLLREIPRTRLVLKSYSLNAETSWQEYRSWFTRRGIEPDRIELRGASPHTQMLAEYGDIDIALDPFPYNGGLTTCEALWMGVPVLAMLGDRMISRQSAALLQAAGLGEFVAQTPAQYVAIAQAWAAAPQRLAVLRAGMRRSVAASALCDARKFARDCEALYRTMWRQWCAALHRNGEQRDPDATEI